MNRITTTLAARGPRVSAGARPARIVVMDASVLINLLHVRRLDLCSSLHNLEFALVEEVRREITRPRQRALVEASIRLGELRLEALSAIEELERFAALRGIMGAGEAASLALAQSRGWMIACDEQRAFLREARARLGEARILNTAGLFVRAIREDMLMAEHIDDAKRLDLQRTRPRQSLPSAVEGRGHDA